RRHTVGEVLVHVVADPLVAAVPHDVRAIGGVQGARRLEALPTDQAARVGKTRIGIVGPAAGRVGAAVVVPDLVGHGLRGAPVAERQAEGNAAVAAIVAGAGKIPDARHATVATELVVRGLEQPVVIQVVR